MKLERERQPRITCTMPNRDDVDDNTASLMGIVAVITIPEKLQSALDKELVPVRVFKTSSPLSQHGCFSALSPTGEIRRAVVGNVQIHEQSSAVAQKFAKAAEKWGPCWAWCMNCRKVLGGPLFRVKVWYSESLWDNSPNPAALASLALLQDSGLEVLASVVRMSITGVVGCGYCRCTLQHRACIRFVETLQLGHAFRTAYAPGQVISVDAEQTRGPNDEGGPMDHMPNSRADRIMMAGEFCGRWWVLSLAKAAAVELKGFFDFRANHKGYHQRRDWRLKDDQAYHRGREVTGRQARMVPGKTTFWKTFAKRYAAGGRPKTWKRLS
ncbi:hypothetical protein An01g13330 [Aspergillus niger]|uniref:Uncharacterized protein n=2 Tax=Aspergillus niger TaxID=5061 RepID=A2QAZ5_ASPNC|nr:hypothetical protein An01g13330 [Aspergillus niger]CAK96203.1 hypothetical protein An01g13330 [Aspergillus niger]